MEIKGVTKCTAKLLRKFNRFHMLKNKLLIITYSVLEILLILMFIGLFLSDTISDVLPQIIIVGFFILLLPGMFIIIPVIMALLQKNIIGIENSFCFTEEILKIYSTGLNLNSQTEMKYEMVCRVYEKPDVFYIYLSKIQGYILLKKDIEENKINDLRNLLQAKLSPGKYIRK